MTEPVNLTQRLEVLRDHLLGAPSPNSLSDVHAAVEAILGPLESQVTLYHLLAGLRGPTATNLGDVLEGLAALKGSGADNLTTMGAKLDEVVSQLDNVRQAVVAQEGRLDSIQAALGGEPYNDLELATTRGLLQALLNCCRAARLGEFPATQPTDGRSVGAVISGGRKYALWPNPPEGVTVAANGFDITANWSGWQAYIQTTDPAPQIGGVADAPNMWLELVGTGTINFSVELNYPVTVHLRPPPGPGAGTYRYTSESHMQNDILGYSYVLTGYPGITLYTDDGSAYPPSNKTIFFNVPTGFRVKLLDAPGGVAKARGKDGPNGLWFDTPLVQGEWVDVAARYRNVFEMAGSGIRIDIGPQPA